MIELALNQTVGDTRTHTAIATATHRNGDTFVLAMRNDGNEYVTWAYGPADTPSGIGTFWGHYHAASTMGFAGAYADLMRRAGLNLDGSEIYNGKHAAR